MGSDWVLGGFHVVSWWIVIGFKEGSVCIPDGFPLGTGGDMCVSGGSRWVLDGLRWVPGEFKLGLGG